MKIFILALTIIHVLFIGAAYAGSPHNEPVVINNYITVEPTTTNSAADAYDSTDIVDSYSVTNNYTTEVSNEINDGVALNLSAAALNFDWGTNDWQYSGGLGNTESRTAGSIGIGKRIGGIMLNGSYNRAMESGKEGYNIGLTGRF